MAANPLGGVSTALMLTSRAAIAVQVRTGEGRAEIVRREAVEMPAGAMDGAVVREPAAVAQAIRVLWRRMENRSRAVAVVLPSSGYSLRALRLPSLPIGERRSVVRNELEQGGALPFGGGSMDFYWLNAPVVNGPAQADAYAYYTSDVAVEGTRQAVRQAGLQLIGLEPASIATMRAYLATNPRREPVALLYPSEKYSDLCVHDGLTIRHLRRIPAGWADLPQMTAVEAVEPRGRSAHVREHFGGLTPAEEEPLPPAHTERDVPIPSVVWSDFGEFAMPDAPAPSAAPPPRPAPEPEILSPTAPPSGPSLFQETPFLVSEVARSLAFYAREHEDEARPRSLVVLGAGAIARDVQRLLDGTQSIPVLTAERVPGVESPADVRVSEDEILAALGAACGAGGSEAGLSRLDLAQQEEFSRNRSRRTVVVVSSMAACVVWLLASAGAAVGLTLLELGAQAESARLANEIRQVNEARAPAIRYHELSVAAKAARDRAHVPAASVLGRVASASNPGISLRSLSVNPDGRVAVEGDALDTRFVQRFAFDVGQGESVKLPVIENLRRDQQKRERLGFRIAGTFRGPQPAPARRPAGNQE